MLMTLLSLPVSAAQLTPVAPPLVPAVAREIPVPRLVRVQKRGPRFAQRRLMRPSAGEGTPIVFSRTEHVVLLPATGAFTFEPGTTSYTAWPDAQTAWLVRDLNHDGRITSGRELFGSFTQVAKRKASHGFEALAALDANRDGVLTSSDPAYGELALWFDRNGDRVTQPGELEALGELVVPVGFVVEVHCDSSGNCERERAPVAGGWLIDLHLTLLARPSLTRGEHRSW